MARVEHRLRSKIRFMVLSDIVKRNTDNSVFVFRDILCESDLDEAMKMSKAVDEYKVCILGYGRAVYLDEYMDDHNEQPRSA